MHAKLTHAQRGQAVAETVVFLPMFLLTLFGIIWAVQTAVQYERVESAVRYSGLVSQYTNPYANYSLYAMYNQLGSTTLPTVSCGTVLSTPLNDGSPTFTTTASAPFWSPSTTPTPGCLGNGTIGWAAGTGFTQDVIVSHVWPSMTSSAPVPPALKAVINLSISAPEADDDFFQQVGINTIIACYPTLSTQVQNSLVYTDDTSASTLPLALPSVVVPISPAANSICVTP